MFGFDSEEKKFRNVMASLGVPANVLRSWQKKLEKTQKAAVMEREKYFRVKGALAQLEKELLAVEQCLREQNTVELTKEYQVFLKELKSLKGCCDHEFLISSENQEFHSTYDTLLRMGAEPLADEDERLIVQSEIENLIELTKEALDRKPPDFFHLGYYFTFHNWKELCELSPQEKINRVWHVFEREFLKEIQQHIQNALTDWWRQRGEWPKELLPYLPDAKEMNRTSLEKVEIIGIDKETGQRVTIHESDEEISMQEWTQRPKEVELPQRMSKLAFYILRSYGSLELKDKSQLQWDCRMISAEEYMMQCMEEDEHDRYSCNR